MRLSGSLSIFWHCLSLGLEWKLTFSSPVATAEVFQICWHIEFSTFTTSSFRIWNSTTGIPSPPLALLAAVLPKAHLTSHSRMSDSEWGTIPLWLSWSLRSSLYSSSVYSFCLFLISSTSIRCLPFLSFIVPSFVWNVPLIFPIFLEISLVLPFLLFSSISRHSSRLPLLIFGTLH